MDKTQRLYYEDSFLYRFDAVVTDAAPGADNRLNVVLDRTAMYPTSGGQPFDTGKLRAGERDYRVLEVVDREADEAVIHVVEGRSELAAGMQVTGEIDEPRRRDHMQQHSGQHVLSA